MRDEFRCVVLDPGDPDDLEIHFQAKYLSYTDDNPDLEEEHREGVVQAMEKDGSAYFSDAFNQSNNRSFIILTDSNAIIGSANLICHDDMQMGYLCSSHIHSQYRGLRLVDMLFEAREAFVAEETPYKFMMLQIDPNNLASGASQKAAIRNGFVAIGADPKEQLLNFEKRL